MNFSIQRKRRALVSFALCVLLALLTVIAGPGQRAHAVNGSTSPCALRGRGTEVDAGQNTNYTKFLNPAGTKNIGLVYVDFPDTAGAGDVADYYNLLSPAADWMRNASYGKASMNMRSVLERWIRMPSNSNTYGSSTYEQHTRYVTEALRAAANAGANLAGYDAFYIIATAHSQISGSAAWFWIPSRPIVVNGTTIRSVVTFGTDMWNFGFKVADHETAHLFGGPDLYAFGGDLFQYTGGWDVLGNIDGREPQFFGWNSWKFGWTGDDQVVCVFQRGTQNTARLHGVEYFGGKKLLVVRTGPTTAYVAEARRRDYNDDRACSTGVLIYKVDTSIATGRGPIRVVRNPNAAAPPAGCGPLDMATWQPGQTFYDSATKVQFNVQSAEAFHSTVNGIWWR